MDSLGQQVYAEVDPAKKNTEWANKCIQVMRMYWRPLVDNIRLFHNREEMFSMNSIKRVEDSFQDEDFKANVKFKALPILENLLNTIVEETTKNPPKTEVRATDPSAINDKKEDIQILKRRGILEQDISKYQQQVGLPEYKMDYNKFKGNVEEFDRMGLDERDPDDINFYSEFIQRLWYEISGQAVLDNVMKVNEFDQATTRRLIKDIFAVKAIATQCYVDRISGEIKSRYIDPGTARGIFGNTNDGKDDTCRGWEDNVTIMEWLQMVGEEFSFDRDWKQLLFALNYTYNGDKFTGFIRNGVSYICSAEEIGFSLPDGQQNLIEWSNINTYGFKVAVGYIEWRSPEVTGSYLRSNKNPDFVEPVPYSYEVNKKKQLKEYFKEVYYQNQWYCSYFIATTSMSQWCYGFQKVYYQQLEGANDEYSNGTLCYYREEGLSAAEIAEPYLEPANFAFYRMLWVIYKSKPEEDQYLIEEVIQLAKAYQREFGQDNNNGKLAPFDSILTQIIQTQRKSHVRFRAYPQIQGQTIPQLPETKVRGTGGVDPIAVSMQLFSQWAEQQIAIKIGINPLRTGGNPPARESTNTENMILQNSINTTSYMYRMVQYVKEHLAIVVLNYAQDIIKFKDSVPYKWIRNLIGTEAFDGLKSIEKFCAHRMGIFIEDYNKNIDMNEVKQAANMSLTKGTLTQDQWFLVTQTQDPKRANAILSRMLRIKDKKEKAFQMQQLQTQEQMAQNAFDRQVQIIQLQGQVDQQTAKISAEATIYSADKSAEAKIVTKQLQNENEIPKQAAKSQGEKEVLQTEANLEQQKVMNDVAA